LTCFRYLEKNRKRGLIFFDTAAIFIKHGLEKRRRKKYCKLINEDECYSKLLYRAFSIYLYVPIGVLCLT